MSKSGSIIRFTFYRIAYYERRIFLKKLQTSGTKFSQIFMLLGNFSKIFGVIESIYRGDYQQTPNLLIPLNFRGWGWEWGGVETNYFKTCVLQLIKRYAQLLVQNASM